VGDEMRVRLFQMVRAGCGHSGFPTRAAEPFECPQPRDGETNPPHMTGLGRDEKRDEMR